MEIYFVIVLLVSVMVLLYFYGRYDGWDAAKKFYSGECERQSKELEQQVKIISLLRQRNDDLASQLIRKDIKDEDLPLYDYPSKLVH